MATAVEAKLDHWVPDKESDQMPRAATPSPQVDVAGKWAVYRGGYGGSSLTITRSGQDTYDITLDTYGCCGRWTLRRTGRYSGGVLVLSRLVEEYGSLPYQKLYASRGVGGTEFLVPGVAVGRFQNEAALDGTWVPDDMWMRLFALTRMPSPTPGASQLDRAAPQPNKLR